MRIGSPLRAFEECYGLELGDGSDPDFSHAHWDSPVAVQPYPASVRARRIAVAIRCGSRGLEGELARAARAVLLQPELHLLGNHLLENAIGLACAGAVVGAGGEGDLWWKVGTALLGWQLPQQFLADGGHIERSASYHLAITAGLVELIELARAAGRHVPPLVLTVASRALGWALAVRAPDGSYPLFNDCALDSAPSIGDVLALGDALGLSASMPQELAATGWLRVDVGGASLVVDAGPDAEGWQPGHAHADGLSFELWVEGRRAAVDFGVASYERGDARDETRATRSHNTVEIAGLDSCEVWGAFRVGRRGRGRVLARDVSLTSARLRIEHDGYAWMPGAPKHRRELMLGPRCLEVRDAVSGSVDQAVSRLRLDEESPVRVSGDGDVRSTSGVWYPRLGRASAARVYAQPLGRATDWSARWKLEW